MKLITGGAYQGKLAFARKEYGLGEDGDWADGAVCGREELFSRKGICHFHLFVRRMLEEGTDVSGLARELAEKNSQAVIVTTEVGCGVVPVEPAQRTRREAVGRLCCRLAARAERVERIFCGLPMVLKGEGPWN